jgi:hypothetical protein
MGTKPQKSLTGRRGLEPNGEAFGWFSRGARSMNWWRSRRRCGAGLGLLALVVQLVLSFGHIHADELRPAAAPRADIVALSDRTSPPHHVPPGHPDDDCPICMAVHMAATGLVAAPPALAIPSDFCRLTHVVMAPRRIIVARHVLFRTRAPPAA